MCVVHKARACGSLGAVFGALLTALWSVSAAPAKADGYSGDGGMPAFYTAPPHIPPVPGRLLASQPLGPERGLPSASAGYRMIYSSRSIVSDRPIPVSGAFYIPKGPQPAGGWPVIAWAHPTLGVADVCAPSWLGDSPTNSAYLDKWLRNGFAVVTTDYEGMGLPGRHPYLNYRAEARGVLDSVRAARAFAPGQLANIVLPAGHSQGSGGAIGAAYIAKQYAPDVNVVGAIATGLVVQTVRPGKAHQLAIPTWGDDPKIAAFEVMYFLGLHRSFQPDLSVDDWVSERAKPIVAAGMTGCWKDMVAAADKLQLKPSEVFKRDISGLRAQESEHAYMPDGVFSVPLFTAIGLSDQTAGLEGQYNFVSAACAAGSKVSWRYYLRVTHRGAVNASFEDSLAFARTIVAGDTPPSRCPALTEPGSLQPPDPSIPMND